MTPHLGRLSVTRFLDYLRERLPGAGLIITPAGSPVYAATTYPDGVGTLPPGYRADNDAVLPRPAGSHVDDSRAAWELVAAFLGQQADLVHAAGSVLVGQIHHPGAERSWDSFQPSVAPSALDGEWPVQRPHELTDAEIDATIASYVATARWIVDAGADGVEVHAAHGYLLNRFLSPYYNRRVGRYGGTAGGRWAVLREILDGIRAAIGPEPILGVRLPAFEQLAGGLTTDEVAAGAGSCAPWLSYVNLSLGNHDGLAAGQPVLAYTTPWLVERPDLTGAAAAVRQATNLPVVLTGGVVRAADVESLLSRGADLVGIARAAIADPGFARKVLAGRGDEIAECIGCNECTLVPFSCPANPAAGREAELRTTTTRAPRTVVVIGGGPAGLTLGLTAAARGHQVTLYERSEQLGGRLAELVRDPVRARWRSLLDRLTAQAGDVLDLRLGVDITDTGSVLSGLSEQDIVVVATGGVPAPAAFTDDGSVPILTSSEILRGQPVDHDGLVLVVGGTEPHLDPLLTARLLAAQGHPVRVITELVTVAPTVEQRTFNHVLRTLATFDVAVETSTRLAAIAAGQARTVQLLAGRTAGIPIGAVVLAHSRRPDPLAARLAAGLRGTRTVHIVGDALAPRRLTHAVLEGTRFGASL